MQMQIVTSSNVAAVGYDDQSKSMQILFVSGALYEHRNVERADYQALLRASSVGSHYRRTFVSRYGKGTKIR